VVYFFIGGLDILHTLTFRGMPIFEYQFHANQLWIAARYMESISLFIGFFFLNRKKKLNAELVFLIYSVITALIIFSIFIWKVFPIAFIEGQGQTPFKLISEYIISMILLGTIWMLYRKKRFFDSSTLSLLAWSLGFTIVSELFFTFYISNYGISNLFGHFFKIASFYLIYKAVIERGLNQPFQVLFRELKQSEERFRDLSDLLPICVFETDFENRVHYRNQMMNILFPEGRRTLESLFASEEIPKIAADLRSQEDSGDILKGEYTALNRFDEPFPVLFYSSLIIQEGTLTGRRCLILDITERKQMEEALKESNRELQDFASAASHDLKEPLRTISIFLELIQKNLEERGVANEEVREYLGYAVNGSKRLQTLIHNLLAYAMLSRDGKNFETVNLDEAVSQVLDNLQLAISENHAKITVPDLPLVKGDRSQLQRLFLNLLGNALKYRKKEVSPWISIAYEKEDSFYRFSIRDNGIGIESRFFERIFGILQRLHTQEEFEGTGIGLAACKKIVEKHGGRIWVESTPGEGATFFFTLPAAD
jgi:signal transduction histidine kinase